MADVLGLLREYHIGNKEIVETNEEVIFGEFAWPKSAKTNYVMWGTGKDGAPKDYYTLNCIVYLLKNAAGIPVVRLPDRRELLNYLNGDATSAPNIDRTVPVDITIRRAISKGSLDAQNLRDVPIDGKRPRLSSYEPEEVKPLDSQHDESARKKIGSILDQSEGSALPSAISLDKIQSLRAKFRANQQVAKPEVTVDHLGSPDALDPTAVVTGDEPLLMASGVSVFSSRPTDPIYQGSNSQLIVSVDDAQLALARSADPKRAAFLASDMDTVRVISSRERRWRTRGNILQSQGKTFYENIVLGILRNVMLKENAHLAPDRRDAYSGAVGTINNFYKTPLTSMAHQRQQSQPPALQYSRYDQERFATGREDTAGFRIDTMSSYHGKALTSMVGSGVSAGGSKPNGSALSAPGLTFEGSGSTILPPETPGHETPRGARTPRDPRGLGLSTPIAAGLTPDPYRSSRSLASRSKPRASRVPIIIIPAAPTSLITMLNATDILQDLQFVSTEEKRNQGCKRDNELLIHRRKPDGRTVPYRVIDQPNRLQPDEWNRVVAVFVQGQAWQFKGWPHGGDPAVIFSVVKGFHIKYANMPLDPNVAKWNVHVINLDRRRHLDKVNFQSVWDQLDKFIAKNKPFLRSYGCTVDGHFPNYFYFFFSRRRCDVLNNAFCFIVCFLRKRLWCLRRLRPKVKYVA
ncbi:Parafibromin [Echinococcus granulosus]|nr:Parafibromin [Echinococcus granulosus]